MINAIAGADGKHIQLIQSLKACADYRNYEVFYSILTDYDCKFIYFDVGCHGMISDGRVYRYAEFYGALSGGELRLPPPVLCNG